MRDARTKYGDFTINEHSILQLNNEICEHDTWDINEIQARAEKLIADVCKICMLSMKCYGSSTATSTEHLNRLNGLH